MKNSIPLRSSSLITGDIFMISGRVPRINEMLIVHTPSFYILVVAYLYRFSFNNLDIECSIIPENAMNDPINVNIIIISVGPKLKLEP